MSSIPQLTNGNALIHNIPLESGKGLAGKDATSAMLSVLNRTLALKQVTVDMADAAHALVLGTAASAQTRLDGAILLVDPNSTGTAEVLTYNNTEADLSGLVNLIINTGGENITVNNDGGSAVGTIPAGGAAWVVCDGTNLRVHNILAGSDLDLAKLSLLAATALTIASGAVAVTRSNHTVDTEAAAASDDLDTITGGVEGDILFLRAANAARTVVLKHSTGANKIALPGGQPISLADAVDGVMLFHNGTQWIAFPPSVLLTNGQRLIAQGTIAFASVRTLNATPVEMIPAPGAGKTIIVEYVHWFLDFGTAAYDGAAAGDTLVARYTDGSGAAVVDAIAGDAIGAAAADYHTIARAVPEVIPVVNAGIFAHVNVGEWYVAAGDSPLKYEIGYQIRDFAFV